MEPRTLLLYGLALLQAYFLGAVPFGFLLVKLLKGVDIRTVGSGNIGATNVARVAGPRLGILAFLLDVAKGFVAATWVPFAIHALSSEAFVYSGLWPLLREVAVGKGFTDLRILCGLSAIVGHIWTVFLSFKGGKGVATALGVWLGLAPMPTLITVFLWAVITRVSGYVSLGSIISVIVLPLALALEQHNNLLDSWRLLAFAVIVCVIVIIRHKDNIRRLRDGTENRFGFRRRK